MFGCFRQQRYKFLKAIHNGDINDDIKESVVSDNKDTNFWKQFTTVGRTFDCIVCCFRQQRYKFLKAIHNRGLFSPKYKKVVSDNKDTNFWKQFTTNI